MYPGKLIIISYFVSLLYSVGRFLRWILYQQDTFAVIFTVTEGHHQHLAANSQG